MPRSDAISCPLLGRKKGPAIILPFFFDNGESASSYWVFHYADLKKRKGKKRNRVRRATTSRNQRIDSIDDLFFLPRAQTGIDRISINKQPRVAFSGYLESTLQSWLIWMCTLWKIIKIIKTHTIQEKMYGGGRTGLRHVGIVCCYFLRLAIPETSQR